MTNIPPISHKVNITVDDQGIFTMDGRSMDIMGLIFKAQSETSALAQDRLSFIAKELWDTNRQTKMLIFFLNKVRAFRPTGDADSKVSADDVTAACKDYADSYGGDDPFQQSGVADLGKAIYKIIQNDQVKETYYSQSEAENHFGKVFVSFLKIDEGWGMGYGDGPAKVWKSYGEMKQAEVDQLIEGIKSQIANVGSKQELLQNDVQRYTRLSDETKEAMASIEKTLANAQTSLESKI